MAPQQSLPENSTVFRPYRCFSLVRLTSILTPGGYNNSKLQCTWMVRSGEVVQDGNPTMQWHEYGKISPSPETPMFLYRLLDLLPNAAVSVINIPSYWSPSAVSEDKAKTLSVISISRQTKEGTLTCAEDRWLLENAEEYATLFFVRAMKLLGWDTQAIDDDNMTQLLDLYASGPYEIYFNKYGEKFGLRETYDILKHFIGGALASSEYPIAREVEERIIWNLYTERAAILQPGK